MPFERQQLKPWRLKNNNHPTVIREQISSGVVVCLSSHVDKNEKNGIYLNTLWQTSWFVNLCRNRHSGSTSSAECENDLFDTEEPPAAAIKHPA